MADSKNGKLLGVDREVAVVAIQDGFEVAFDFDRALVKHMHDVPDAAFDKESGAWVVPQRSEEALIKAVAAMRFESAAIAQDKVRIMELAQKTASTLQVNSGVAPQVSDYRKPGESYSGQIVNVNGHFAAQLTGFGAKDGAAFVTVHRTSDLMAPVMKGDDVRIKYDDKNMGVVVDRTQSKSAAEKFDVALGQRVDGVTVAVVGDKLTVAFDFNPALANRLQRVDGVEFNKADKVYEVPATNKEFVVRAVGDMRREFVLDAQERAGLVDLAGQKMDGARVQNAFTKDGFSYSGEILGVGNRYALQYAGKDEFKLHRRDSLENDEVLKSGAAVKITYNKGRGFVDVKSLGQAADAPEVSANGKVFGVTVDTKKVQSLLDGGKGPDTGVFMGKVVGVDADRGLVYQSQGRGAGAVHLASSLSRLPDVGEMATIKFKDGKGVVADRAQEQAKDRGR